MFVHTFFADASLLAFLSCDWIFLSAAWCFCLLVLFWLCRHSLWWWTSIFAHFLRLNIVMRCATLRAYVACICTVRVLMFFRFCAFHFKWNVSIFIGDFIIIDLSLYCWLVWSTALEWVQSVCIGVSSYWWTSFGENLFIPTCTSSASKWVYYWTVLITVTQMLFNDLIF